MRHLVTIRNSLRLAVGVFACILLLNATFIFGNNKREKIAFSSTKVTGRYHVLGMEAFTMERNFEHPMTLERIFQTGFKVVYYAPGDGQIAGAKFKLANG